MVYQYKNVKPPQYNEDGEIEDNEEAAGKIEMDDVKAQRFYNFNVGQFFLAFCETARIFPHYAIIVGGTILSMMMPAVCCSVFFLTIFYCSLGWFGLCVFLVNLFSFVFFVGVFLVSAVICGFVGFWFCTYLAAWFHPFYAVYMATKRLLDNLGVLYFHDVVIPREIKKRAAKQGNEPGAGGQDNQPGAGGRDNQPGANEPGVVGPANEPRANEPRVRKPANEPVVRGSANEPGAVEPAQQQANVQANPDAAE